MSSAAEKKLDKVIELLANLAPAIASSSPATTPRAEHDEEALYQRIKERLMKEAPQLLKVLVTKPELRIAETRQVIEIDDQSLQGKLAILISNGFFDEAKTGHSAFVELQRLGFKTSKPNVYNQCDKLAAMGFLSKEEGGYLAVADMKRNVVRNGAK